MRDLRENFETPQVGAPLTPQQAMQLAIQEAKKGAGFVSPNPLVGCVILDSKNRYLASSYHKFFGQAHAEMNALEKVINRDQLKGAHLFVTLEPCAHQGKTGSCARALVDLPLGSVTYGLLDPNPLVAGKGIEILEAGGVKTQPADNCYQELEELIEIYLYNRREKKSFVSLKVATSLDGQMALSSGESQWITGDSSRNFAHHLRGQYDSILVGLKTFQKDNPRLNIRLPKFSEKKLKVLILDPRGECLPTLKNSRVYQSHDPQDIIVVVGPDIEKKTTRRNPTNRL